MIAVLVNRVWSRRHPSGEPTVEGPRVTGTAQVLSFKKTSTAVGWGGRITKETPRVCIIELEVHIPGREPYVRVTRPALGPDKQAVVQPGRTVAVEVDGDRPQTGRVKIDFTQPII